MKNLLTGIYSKYSETTLGVHNSLYTALIGGLHLTIAPQPTVYPYGVYMLVGTSADWTFTEDLPEAMIQFSLFDSARSASTLMTIAGYLKDLYHWCSLSVTGYTSLSVHCDMEQLMRGEDDTIWQYVADYRVRLEKAFQ